MKKLVLSAIVVICLSPTLAWCGKITDITVANSERHTVVTIFCDTVPDCRDYVIEEKNNLVLEFKNMILIFGEKSFTVNRGGVTTIGVNIIPDGGFTKIVLNLSMKPGYVLMSMDNNIEIHCTRSDTTSFLEWKASLSPEVVKKPVKKATKKKGVKK